ncbi:4'-phosphopantetheinyl transferase family protein [Legionella longbeachae]|uniref:Putative phosphopantetheinyl transferase n=1 Tax=Legionella longbeachae serogroup 1 (strain NSW150) TaxID=661367 RepID=D3HJ75_LEGLN|nr:4'-phosphopantetheinyl transferase superfamily protein [Legionella longbeachae]VEE02964.1 phosphopantetheinyl transferase [Legionella oakridgensis]HBD7398643.1 4'-phosphopantetheinyl transferase superfamily protein [Legionella pneumophila]ARB90803.1 phosphopantetheine-protein transferase [Legionella longbeachae]ARM32772.1 4'-phosphopantetheinyl transferase superfamily protein [Legionella longbeachae]EEZ94434.1 4'-phosphopantetheinyl transferase family protein [Legionella longbeachae D-4968]
MIITEFDPLNTQNCILNEARIDLWQFSLANELQNTYQLLNSEEQARADRYYFSRHKRRFSIARTVMRVILARYLNVYPEYIKFTYNAHGKPEVINSARLQFNLSHSGDLALLAVGKGFPMGVDIEKYSARPYKGIAKSLFSEQEYEEFIKVPQALKPAVFFHVWSQKEAFIKACGLGLSYPTKEFSVPTSMPTKQLVDDPLHHVTWQLRSFMPEIACSGALCHHPTVREIRHGFIELQHNNFMIF